jgi:dTDP-4-dehydrorhamnose 3,5-epimerase-like enzyme
MNSHSDALSPSMENKEQQVKHQREALPQPAQDEGKNANGDQTGTLRGMHYAREQQQDQQVAPLSAES